jgi:UPF0716 protein FxsA
MFGLLLLVFLVAPLAELYVIVQVAGGVGVPETILLLVAVSMIGASLAKWQGISVLRRMQVTISQGKVPSNELVDGGLIMLAAALMIAPGFITDCIAIALLLPPVRAVVRPALLRRLRAGGGLTTVIGSRRWSTAASDDELWDAESWEAPAPGSRPELER